MSKTSFIHKIIWIPNFNAYPKGLTRWLVIFYNVFLVIAIYRISTAAADNFLQVLAVVAFVFFIFNFIPYQIYLLIEYISRKITNKGVSKEKAPLSLYILLILIIFIIFVIIDIIFNDNKILDLYLCRGSPPVSSGCYDTGGERYVEKWEDIPCLKGSNPGELIPNPDYVGPEVKCE